MLEEEVDRDMTDAMKTILIRVMKLLHFGLTVAAFALCCYIGYNDLYDSTLEFQRFVAAVLIYTLVLLFSMRTYSGYGIGLSSVRMMTYSQTLAQLVAVGVIYVLMVLDRMKLVNVLPLVVLLVCQLVLNCVWSVGANQMYFTINKARRTVIVYRRESDLRRLEEIYQHEKKFRVEKMIADPADDIHALLRQIEGYEAVFVTGVHATLRNGIAKYCVEQNVRCYIAPHVGDVLMMGAQHLELFSVPVFRIMRSAPRIEYLAVKRFIDIACSLLALVAVSPVMLVTALAIRLYDGGPAIYKQVRLTKDGRQFEILKFRSMRVDAERDGVARLAQDHDDRITPVGKVIRACRLDELPQLINILRGDMSIVGPRPERPEIARQYCEQMPAFSLRLQVRAGLTGLAQVYGRYNTDPYDKLQMDLMYINNMSFFEDLKLIFATVKVLFMKESTSGVASGQVTAVVGEDTREYAMK